MSISELHKLKPGTHFKVPERYDAIYIWLGERFVLQLLDGRMYDSHLIFNMDDDVQQLEVTYASYARAKG